MIENLLKKKRTSIFKIVRWKLILHESTSSDWHKNSYIYINRHFAACRPRISTGSLSMLKITIAPVITLDLVK